jgi:hypothetical protein
MAYGHSELSELLSQSESDVLSTLTSHGGAAFQPTTPEYVIHTHTVPLASTVDYNYLYEGKVVSQFHGYGVGNKGEECPKRSCMHVHASGKRGHETIPANCPCLKVKDKNDEPLKPRCFLTYVRSLGRLLASETDGVPIMDPGSIMFCQTHTGLFDNAYPGWLRDNIGVSGWNHVTEGLIVPALRSLYWYRTYSKTLLLDNTIEESMDKLGFRPTRHAITQTIHTLNGILVKKFMAFCPESTRYQDFARQTAYLFRDLLRDYLRPIKFFEGIPVEPEGMTYTELKVFLNVVKKSFHKFTPEKRAEWLDFEFKSKSLRRMFNEITRLKELVISKTLVGLDYTESPAWFFRCTTLCQTRVLGYLPDCIAEVKRRQFRTTISRPLEKPPKENIRLIKLAVTDELRRGNIPRDFMANTVHRDSASRIRFQEAMSAIELPLKGSASTDHFVRQGGKIEDARILINKAIDNKWKIPVRDLHDHEVIETFTVDRVDESSERDYVRPLFWLSYTIILNYMVSQGFYPKQLYYPLREGSANFEPNPMIASIVHISEPGKERNLTKSTGYLAWFLTPASKITQDTLSLLPEHEAGLRASSHEWRHQKRISSLSDESHFIYDILDGKVKPGIIHSFKDWTESTDFIGKRIGWAHLSALFKYIAFPEGYGNLIANAIMEPQPVSEVVAYRNLDDGSDYEPVHWSGSINEGYMMGNPMTKTILHLIHVSERNVVRTVLARAGATEGPRSGYQGLGDPIRLDRNETTSWSKPQTLWS